MEGLPNVNLTGRAYASFWRRLAAYLIDGLLLGVVQAVIALIVYAAAPDDLGAQANFAPVIILLGWAYFALMESSPAQATVGKIALGIYVTDRGGDPIDFRQASFRYWGKVISAAALMFGFLMVAFTPDKRGLHDYLAGTLVLKRTPVPLIPSFEHPDASVGDHWDGSRWTSETGLPVHHPPTRQIAPAATSPQPSLLVDQLSALPLAPAPKSPEPSLLVDQASALPLAPSSTTSEPGTIADQPAVQRVAPAAESPAPGVLIDQSSAPRIAPSTTSSAPGVLVDHAIALPLAPASGSAAAIAKAQQLIVTGLRSLAPTDLLIPIALGMWSIAIAGTRLQAINDFGLIPALPPTFFVALLLLVVSIGVVLLDAQPSRARLVLHLIALVLMLHGTLPLLLPDPQYAYVYKHFGVVDYIATHGSVNEKIDIYQNWPTFFALGAWFDNVAGVTSPIGYAAWAPAYFNLAALLAINASLRTMTQSVQVRWLALFVFAAANWVGQDYFSPQAFAFVLSQAVLACLLAWFRPAGIARWVSRWERKVRRGVRAVLRGEPEEMSLLFRAAVDSRRRVAMLVMAFGIFTVVTISHQLSPYMVIAAAAVLTAIGALRPRWIPFGFAGIAGLYLFLHLDFLRSHGDLLLSLNPFSNAQNPDAAPNDGVLGRVLTAYAARTLSLLVWTLALVGVLRRIRAGWSVAVPLALLGSEFLIIFGLEYGGEAIYRVYLFSLPWAALLAAFALAPNGGAWTKWSSARAGLVLVVLLGLFTQAYFGLTEVDQVRPTEVAASHYFNAHARAGSVLVLAAPDFPERSTGTYAQFVVTSGAFDPQLTRDPRFKNRMFVASDLPLIEAIVTSFGPHGYIAITTGMKDYAHVFKLLPDGSLDSLDQALAASARWRVFFHNQDAVIYEYIGQGSG